MASNLYDTGAPRKVIVVNDDRRSTAVERVIERERVVVVQANVCQECGKPTRTTPCEWCHARREPPREAQRAGPPVIDVAPESAGPLKRLARAAVRLLEPPK